MKTIEELQNENTDLRKKLIKQINENIETLKEKDKLLDELINKNKQSIMFIKTMKIMTKALSEISLGDAPSSLIATEALNKVSVDIDDIKIV